MANLKKKLSKKDILLMSLLSLAGCRLKSCNIIFEKNESFTNLVLGVCDLNAQNESSNTASYGVGAVQFVGNEWFNGDCFIGYKSNDSGILRFTNGVGEELLTKLFLSPDIRPFLSLIKVSRVDYYVVSDSPVTLRNINDFMIAANEVSNIAPLHKNSPIIYTNKQKLIIGKVTSIRYIVLQPLGISSSGIFSKILIEGALTGKAAMEFALMLTSNSAGFGEYAGYNIYEALQKIRQNELIDSIMNLLNKMFSFGKVYLPEFPEATKALTPKDLRPVKSGCTAILNRLITPHLSKKVQEEMINNLILPIIKNKTLISGYDDFEVKILLPFRKDTKTPAKATIATAKVAVPDAQVVETSVQAVETSVKAVETPAQAVETPTQAATAKKKAPAEKKVTDTNKEED
jgi:hypothetical protein